MRNQLPTKTKLDKLKMNVEAQESRLEEGLKMLNEAKKNTNDPGTGQKSAEQGVSSTGTINSEWDALERVIGLMDDLLNSYRTYTKELDKRNKLLSRRSGAKSGAEEAEEQQREAEK
jgi:hypothetical protein